MLRGISTRTVGVRSLQLTVLEDRGTIQLEARLVGIFVLLCIAHCGPLPALGRIVSTPGQGRELTIRVSGKGEMQGQDAKGSKHNFTAASCSSARFQ